MSGACLRGGPSTGAGRSLRRAPGLAGARAQRTATRRPAVALVHDGRNAARRRWRRWPMALPRAVTRCVQELAYGTLRHWGRLEALVRALARKPLDPPLAALVAVALYQLDHTRRAAVRRRRPRGRGGRALARPQAKPLVNALLRRYLRERDALNTAVSRRESRRALVVSRGGGSAACRPTTRITGNRSWPPATQRPPLTLRVNLRRDHAGRPARSVFAAAAIAARPAGRARA